MRNRLRNRLIVVFLAIAVVAIFLAHSRVSVTNPIVAVERFGHIVVRGETVVGQDSFTLAPYYQIPPAKFYVTVITDGYWCINEDCSIDGALIETMGGWLQVERTGGGSDIKEETGLDLPENTGVKTLVIISDSNNKIAGIYPNRGLQDVLPILRLHPDLADFNIINGVNEFGSLKVGEPSPLQPGDDITPFFDEQARFSITNIPKGKKFYIFSAQKRKYDTVGGKGPHWRDKPYENIYFCYYYSGCRYPEPDPPHDFLFAYVDDLDGWFFSTDEDVSAMSELFGIDQEDVLSGASSLVVLTDAKGIITAIHPHKTLSDTLTILSQHPDLADVKKLYRR